MMSRGCVFHQTGDTEALEVEHREEHLGSWSVAFKEPLGHWSAGAQLVVVYTYTWFSHRTVKRGVQACRDSCDDCLKLWELVGLSRKNS